MKEFVPTILKTVLSRRHDLSLPDALHLTPCLECIAALLARNIGEEEVTLAHMLMSSCVPNSYYFTTIDYEPFIGTTFQPDAASLSQTCIIRKG